jgi:hypothetical protein
MTKHLPWNGNGFFRSAKNDSYHQMHLYFNWAANNNQIISSYLTTKHESIFPGKSYEKTKQKSFTTCLFMGCNIHTSQCNQACIDWLMFELLPQFITSVCSMMGVITLMVENQNKEPYH